MTASRDGLSELQAPLKAQYREDASGAQITLAAEASESASALACSVDIGRAIYEAQAHAGVGGQGTAACSGDLLLGALAACAQITCQMVAANAGVRLEHLGVRVEGDLDLRGTLGLNPRVPVGFSKIRMYFDIDAPDASPQRLAVVQRATEQYCVVLQTLMVPPPVEAYWEPPRRGGTND
jgi:uncharacterized OsmC-like protein